MSETFTLRPAYSARQEERAGRGSFVAVTTTTVRNEDGRDETIKAGVTFVHDPGHFLLTRYPELFKRTDGRPVANRHGHRSAQAPARPKAPTWKPLVRRSSAPPTFTALLSDKAYRTITDQAFGQRGEVETGGALFGIPAEKDTQPKIRRAGAPGPNARASRSSLRPDIEHTRREAIELERSGTLDRWVGSWHTHPTTNGQPSDGDLQFFAWDCRELHHMGRSMDDYIALILTPNWDQHPSTYERYLSWARPTITAWRMYAVADDQFIVERGEVERC